MCHTFSPQSANSNQRPIKIHKTLSTANTDKKRGKSR